MGVPDYFEDIEVEEEEEEAEKRLQMEVRQVEDDEKREEELEEECRSSLRWLVRAVLVEEETPLLQGAWREVWGLWQVV